MADEIDLRLAEVERERSQIQLALEQEKTLQAKADATARKSEGWLRFVVGGVIGAVAAYSVAFLEYRNRDREIDLELAKLSLTILSGEYDKDNPNESLPARKFALRALQKGTGVTIGESDLTSWAKTGATPSASDNIWGLNHVDLDGVVADTLQKFSALDTLSMENDQLSATSALEHALRAATLQNAEERCTTPVYQQTCGYTLDVQLKSGRNCIAIETPNTIHGWRTLCVQKLYPKTE